MTIDLLERRVDELGAKVDRFRAELSGRITALDGKVDAGFAALEGKVSGQFRWLLGTQLTVFVTVITVLAGALFVR